VTVCRAYTVKLRPFFAPVCRDLYRVIIGKRQGAVG